MTRLPDYLLPQRLAQMSSFEIVLPLSKTSESSHVELTSDTLVPLLDTPRHHTGIKRLHLCLASLDKYYDVEWELHSTMGLAVDEFIITTAGVESVVLQVDDHLLPFFEKHAHQDYNVGFRYPTVALSGRGDPPARGGRR